MRINLIKLMTVLALGVVICLPGVATADLIINANGFGSGALVESFEGITPNGSNTGAVTYENYFAIGTTGPYTFTSGVMLSTPVPARNWENGGPYIHDFAIVASNQWGNRDDFSSNGALYQSTQMPAGFGTAYIGVYRTDNTNLTFTFPTEVMRAGVYLTGWPCDSTNHYTLQALDVDGNVLESDPVYSAAIGNWGTNFIGIELSSGFRSLNIMGSGQQWNGNNAVVDMLTYEIYLAPLSSSAVPLPPTLLLMGSGLIGLGFLPRRKKSDV